MRKTLFRFTVLTVLCALYGCEPAGGQVGPTSDSVSDPGEDPGIDIIVKDPAVPDGDGPDLINGDLIQGDKPATDPGVDDGVPGMDVESEDIPSDLGGDPVADTGPQPPFAGCDVDHPCKDPVQVLCLLLPGNSQGVCVQPCEPGDAAGCLPWQECVTVSTSPDLSACFTIAYYGEPCSLTDGVLCDAERFQYCLDESGSTKEGRCTRFCDPAAPNCAYWEECKLLPPPGQGGACFDKAPPLSCPDGKCLDGQVCEKGVCMQSCETDKQCGPAEHCLPAGLEKACLPYEAPVGDTCAPEYGLVCREGLDCLPNTDGLKGYCSRTCSEGQGCPVFMACVDGWCVRHDRLDPGAGPCNEQYPCADQGRTCVAVMPEMGLCLVPCDPGPCPSATKCVEGGCAYVSGPGEVCGPDRGVLCEEGLTCLSDESVDYHFGFCTRPCGAGCPAGLECVGGWCAQRAGYGDECSHVGGILCDGETELECMVVHHALRRGYCTRNCTKIGQYCDAPFPGASSMCLFIGDPPLCGMTCGSLGGVCPDYLSCDPGGLCLF